MLKNKFDSKLIQDEQIKKLYDMAKQVAIPKVINEQMCSGGVGAAVLTKNGNVYTGVCIDTDCSLGMCAERNALSTMISNGEYDVEMVVAVTKIGKVIPPCGACREFMCQLNNSKDIKVIVDNEGTVVNLEDLMPYPYYNTVRTNDMVRLEAINPDNWRLSLKVRDDQSKYVSDTNRILARAYAFRNNRSRAFVIYDDETPIGMAMYYDLDDAYDFSQFFIDERFQGKGYGFKAAKLVLQKMKDDGVFDRVILCYVDGDETAKNLYLKLGFHHTGETDGNEIVMEKILRKG